MRVQLAAGLSFEELDAIANEAAASVVEIMDEAYFASAPTQISAIGQKILAMRMLLDQLETCSAAVARGYRTVTLLHGKDHDVLRAWRETADSLQCSMRIFGEILKRPPGLLH